MRMARFPLTYDECRARFRRTAGLAGASLERIAIDARGPEGQDLTLDVARLGPASARRVLVILSGTHGVEGTAGSMIQQQLLGDRKLALPEDCAVLMIHAVNPWGFAFGRRQNESNVDLNRNSVDFAGALPENPGYRELHPWLCPESIDDDSERAFLEAAGRFVSERGFDWVKQAVTRGQYELPDGLYHGGARRETSTEIVADVFRRHVAGAEAAFCIDLHTGHGEFGTWTILVNGQEPGSSEHAWLRRAFGPDPLELPRDDGGPGVPHKVGQLAPAMVALLPGVRYGSVTFELGTVDDGRMIRGERREHWLHRFGDRNSPLGREIVWENRICSIPDSAEWEALALAHGRAALTGALRELFVKS